MQSKTDALWKNTVCYKRPPAPPGRSAAVRLNAKLVSRLTPLAFLLGTLVATPLRAAPSDALHPFFGISTSYDDNLLRVPDNDPGFDNVRADWSRQVEGGLLFDKGYGRQNVFLQAKLTKVKFDHFQQLNYDGKDFLGRLAWQLGNHLQGNLGANYTVTLAPYTDIRTNERNLRTQRQVFFDGGWRFHSSWQLTGAASSAKYDYDLLSQRQNNRTEKAYEVGPDYLARSGSTFGLRLRQVSGRYPEHRSIAGLLIDDGFDQDEIKAKINWLASGLTSVQFFGGWVKRKHATFADRDSSGANGRLVVVHLPTGKLRFTTSVWREFAALDSAQVPYSLNKGVSFGPTWEATSKIRVDSLLSYEKRDFSINDPSVSLVNNGDNLRLASLSVTYSPIRPVQLVASVYHQSRSGGDGFRTRGFSATGTTINANVKF